MPGLLQTYQAQLSYFLIDESRFDDAELAKQTNLVAALFRLENSQEIESISRIIGVLVTWLGSSDQDGLRRAFTEWLQRVLLPAHITETPVQEMHDLQEVNAMLAERVKEWTREWESRGIALGEARGEARGIALGEARGIALGKAQGMVQGEAELLSRLLTKRFGPLPVWATEKLEGASLEQIQFWSERIFEAGGLDDVFA